MSVYVAYNDYGDLIAEAETYYRLLWAIGRAGYYIEDVIVGRLA